MRAVVQRVLNASVTIDGEVVSKIERGFLVLLGVSVGDTVEDCDFVAKKIAGLRVFEDENGKMNESLEQAGGAVLVVPNFTIEGDCKKGNRPSFIKAARPEEAIPLFERFKEVIRECGIEVGSGVFGADMKVALINDGPVTLIVDSK